MEKEEKDKDKEEGSQPHTDRDGVLDDIEEIVDASESAASLEGGSNGDGLSSEEEDIDFSAFKSPGGTQAHRSAAPGRSP